MLLLLHNVGIRLWYHSWPKLENFVDISAEKVAKKSVPVRIAPCFRLIFDQKRTDISSILARFIDFWTLLGMESFHRWCQLKLWKKTVDKTSSKRFKRFHEGFQEEKVGISKIFLQHNSYFSRKSATKLHKNVSLESFQASQVI